MEEVMEWMVGTEEREERQEDEGQRDDSESGGGEREDRREAVQSDGSVRAVRTESMEVQRGLEVHQLSHLSMSWTSLSLQRNIQSSTPRSMSTMLTRRTLCLRK